MVNCQLLLLTSDIFTETTATHPQAKADEKVSKTVLIYGLMMMNIAWQGTAGGQVEMSEEFWGSTFVLLTVFLVIILVTRAEGSSAEIRPKGLDITL